MSEGTERRAHPGGLSFSAPQRVGSPARLWQPQGRSGTMNTLADCAIARHGDEVSSASISLQPALTAPRQARAVTRQSLYRWGADDRGRGLAIIDALAEYWTSGRTPGGGRWVRACMSRGDGLFDRSR